MKLAEFSSREEFDKERNNHSACMLVSRVLQTREHSLSVAPFFAQEPEISPRPDMLRLMEDSYTFTPPLAPVDSDPDMVGFSRPTGWTEGYVSLF